MKTYTPYPSMLIQNCGVLRARCAHIHKHLEIQLTKNHIITPMKSKRIFNLLRQYIVYCAIIVVFIIIITFIDILEPFSNLIRNSGIHIILPSYIIIIIIMDKINDKLLDIYKKTLDTWGKAKDEELFREDRILLTLVGFSQATLYLLYDQFFPNIEEIFSLLFRLNVIIVAGAFSLTRGYAHIKNSPRWRHTSMKILIITIIIEMPILIWSFILTEIGAILIFGYDISGSLSSVFSIPFIFLYRRLGRTFKTRYGKT